MASPTRIIRSNRKTIALYLHPDGVLEVRAPHHVTEAYIQELLEKKSAWIAKKQRQLRSTPIQPPAHKYVDGERFFFLGKTYPLVNSKGTKSSLELNKKFILTANTKTQARKLFTSWYIKQARQVISERVGFFANLLGFKFTSLRITSARQRWGSCGTKGSLNFSWRLVMAPQPIIDYVIIHELVHLDEKNHSKLFWKKVEQFMPRYKEYRRWLKLNGHLLTID